MWEGSFIIYVCTIWYLLRSPKWSWGFMIWCNLSVVWLLTLFALNRQRFSISCWLSYLFLFWLNIHKIYLILSIWRCVQQKSVSEVYIFPSLAVSWCQVIYVYGICLCMKLHELLALGTKVQSSLLDGLFLKGLKTWCFFFGFLGVFYAFWNISQSIFFFSCPLLNILTV